MVSCESAVSGDDVDGDTTLGSAVSYIRRILLTPLGQILPGNTRTGLFGR